MDSATPRGRIDQFYVSKKRKSSSPALKFDKSGKEANVTGQVFPNVKGNLGTYLRTSQDNHGSVKFSTKCRRLLTGYESLKEALESEINKPLGIEHEQSHLVDEMPTAKSCELIEKGKSNGVFLGDRDLVGGCPRSAQGTEGSELKQFATDFLSLYCSELQQNLNVSSDQMLTTHKRHNNPLGKGLNETSEKRQCFSKELQLVSETVSTGDKLEGAPSRPIVNCKEHDFKMAVEAVDSSFSKLEQSLRKCSEASVSVINSTECKTPGSSIVKADSKRTPKSSGGSSMISPGEAFWNEAIQMADELFAHADVFPDEIAKKIDDGKSLYAINGENFQGNRKEDEKLVKVSDEVDKALVTEVGNSFQSLRKCKDIKDNEVSPLPVKHLDFLYEDKITNGSSTGSLGDREPSEFVDVNHSGVSIKHHDQEERIEKALPTPDRPNVKLISTESVSLANQDMCRIEPTPAAKEINRFMHVEELNEAGTPSSIVPQKACLSLSNWLPSELCSTYKKKGMSELYQWQVDCLQVEGVLQKRNLVYCASTSAGKSFVAEILMLRRVISTGKMALLVLPYVSICAEKAEHLERLLEPLGRQVRSYYGNQGGGTLPKDTSVAVCTIEKANSLVNKLLEEGRLSEIGIIVIDELHMVGDQSRGYLLELLLTKLRYAAGEGSSDSSSGGSPGSSSGKSDPACGLQIVGMSATMPNVEAVANWLQAALYQTDFRPVPLEEYIKVGNTIYNKKLEIVRTIPRTADLGGKDPDHVVELCNEVVQEGNSVLIFCSSRKGCETTARHISKFLKKFSATVHSSESELPDIVSVIEALKRCPVGLDPVLEETLPSGVAYHHAGLTVEEREIVETCYRKGLIRVLTATSTLAAGVNLPARRVIFRQPRIGRDFIDGTRYKQMAGRAGRTGIDTKGESVLICRPEETKRVTGLVCESCPPLQSCLSEDKNGMTHAILEVVACSMVQTASDIHRYVRCTLLNSTKPFEDVVKAAQDSLRWLCHKKFLDWNEETKLYSATPLGRASFGSSLCPEESLIVLDDLFRAREGFVLASDLHLVYLVTPINVDVEPDWELYYERFMQLSKLEQSVGHRVGVAEPFLMRMAHGVLIRPQKSRDGMKGLRGKIENQVGVGKNNVLSDEQTLRVCKRFYVALILSRLVQEAPVGDVCEAFKVARGMVQALQENAGRFASMVSVFCERLGWHDLEGLVAKFQNRVSFGVRAEVVELTTIPYVKGSRARALYKAGLRTPQAIAEASIPEIAKALFESSSWAAQESTAQRRLQLGVAKKIKNGARKIVLDKAEEAQVAAFSAFKSLGLDVPQFSRPLLATATTDSTEQEDADTILGKISPGRITGGEKADNVVVELRTEGNSNVENAATGKEVNSASASQTSISAEISIRGYATNSHQFSAIPVQSSDMDVAAGGGTNTGINCLDQERILPTRDSCAGNKDIAYDNGPVNAVTFPGGFDSFLELWDTQQEYYFDIHYNKCSEVNSKATFEIHGIAICWANSLVYYISFPKDLMWSGNKKNGSSLTYAATDSCNTPACNHSLKMLQNRWGRISEILGKVGVLKITWNLKVQIQAFRRPAVSVQRFGDMDVEEKYSGLEFLDSSHLLLPPIEIKDGIDMSIAAWLLWPDEERCSTPNLEKEVKKRLSGEAAAAANQSGRWKNQMRRAAHNGCCRRVAQVRALYEVLWKLLVSEELIDVLMNIETPLVNVLADMELWGIGISMEGCLWARNLLGKKLRCLEKEAHKLAGMTFSLYTAADVANILFVHLKLPIPEGCSKTKQHLSTDKHCLDLLKNEHPIVPVIREHRTLSKLLNSTLGSICALARLSPMAQKHTLHGHWLQTSTATGRLSMEEPNLQCVEHMVDFKLAKDKNEDDTCYKVNVRDFFTPTQDNWLILTADYSQIELRLMAHFSKDSSLIKLLSKPEGDVFTMMAARWTERPEDSVSSQEREQFKRLIYGILYGMGADTLAEQLNCSSDEAKGKIESFKSSFPGVASWLREAVSSCRQRGYVKTLMGRKRFLSKIKYGDSKEKSKAQRQAVNSICQGSAADIIKMAMINIYSAIVGEVDQGDPSSTTATKFDDLKGRCRMLLQVHDELVLEVEPSVVKQAACLVRTSMEGSASLLVPLRVKLQIGRTWGSLEPFHSGVADEMLEQKT